MNHQYIPNRKIIYNTALIHGTCTSTHTVSLPKPIALHSVDFLCFLLFSFSAAPNALTPLPHQMQFLHSEYIPVSYRQPKLDANMLEFLCDVYHCRYYYCYVLFFVLRLLLSFVCIQSCCCCCCYLATLWSPLHSGLICCF